ncbi:MAG: hypothetical protein WD069_14340 [Planctomycetales bacterium]
MSHPPPARPETGAGFRIERATISLAPRTLSHCLDLAAMFYGRRLRDILRLWACFAVPCCLAAWWLAARWQLDVRTVLGLVYFASLPMGVLLVAGAAASSFGGDQRGGFVRFDRRVLRLLGPGMFRRLVIAVGPALVLFPAHWSLVLLGLAACLFPSAWLLVRTGFAAEESLLAELDHRHHGRRVRELVRGETADLCVRGVMLLAFCLLVGVVLFLTVDGASGQFFQFPIFVERVTDGEILGDEAAAYLFTSPRTLVPLAAVILLVYPLGRLAWFFCYIDIRVRRDCWDVELLMTREALRLEGQS